MEMSSIQLNFSQPTIIEAMRILIVEDEHRIATTLKKGLEQERFAVDVVFDGQVGYDLASAENFDVLILDIMLPGMDGITICKNLRAAGNHTPILMLTAKSQVRDKVEGLDTGADDYLTKPFSFEELLARVRALIRRPPVSSETVLTVGDLSLDPTNFDVRRNGVRITLSGKEYALLEYLMRNAGRVLTKDQIITHVWNYDSDILPNTVEVYIRTLRKKIDAPSFGRPLISTVRGFGYKFGE